MGSIWRSVLGWLGWQQEQEPQRIPREQERPINTYRQERVSQQPTFANIVVRPAGRNHESTGQRQESRVSTTNGSHHIEKHVSMKVEGSDESQYKTFDESGVQINRHSNQIVFYGNNLISFLIGSGRINLENVERVTKVELKRHYLSESIRDGIACVVLQLPGPENINIVREMFVFLLKGDHYRKQAYEFNDQSIEFAKSAQYSYKMNQHRDAQVYSARKTDYQNLYRSYSEKAKNNYFAFYNKNRGRDTIDLHGLHAYWSHSKQKTEQDYHRNVVQHDDGSEWIEEKTYGEAIEVLEARIKDAQAHREKWLEIIVGAGNHSRGQQQAIRPAAEKYLREKNFHFDVVNKGSLLITFIEYTGRQPCSASFYCQKCNKPWDNRYSWAGYYQKCYKCSKECFPFKLRLQEEGRKPSSRNRDHFLNLPDHRELCGKCIQDGVDCRREFTHNY